MKLGFGIGNGIGEGSALLAEGRGDETVIHEYFFKKNFPQKIYKLSTCVVCLAL